MKPITFCDHCRGMEVGWNRKYIRHNLVCLGGFSKSFRVFIYAAATVFVISTFPTSTAVVFSSESADSSATEARSASGDLELPISDPAVAAVADLLRRHSRVSAVDRARISRAVVASARKYDVDPFLVTGILLVESSGNPFAISSRDAVGIMQIHVPTWGSLVDQEEINLFRVEDNIDLGTRILKDYTQRHGLWDGVIRYLGAPGPTAEAVEYVSRVQRIYGDRQAD